MGFEIALTKVDRLCYIRFVLLNVKKQRNKVVFAQCVLCKGEIANFLVLHVCLWFFLILRSS